MEILRGLRRQLGHFSWMDRVLLEFSLYFIILSPTTFSVRVSSIISIAFP